MVLDKSVPNWSPRRVVKIGKAVFFKTSQKETRVRKNKIVKLYRKLTQVDKYQSTKVFEYKLFQGTRQVNPVTSGERQDELIDLYR